MKSLVFTPCEKVIQDPQAGQSLIAVFHGIKFQLLEGQDVPPNAVVPKEWAVFSKWGVDPDEEGKSYSSLIEMFWPDGTEFAKLQLEANQPTVHGMAFVHKFNGFPIGQHGILRILNTLFSDGTVVAGPIEVEVGIEILPLKAAGQ